MSYNQLIKHYLEIRLLCYSILEFKLKKKPMMTLRSGKGNLGKHFNFMIEELQQYKAERINSTNTLSKMKMLRLDRIRF